MLQDAAREDVSRRIVDNAAWRQLARAITPPPRSVGRASATRQTAMPHDRPGPAAS